ncbi:MAG: hypothetical protein PHG63_03645 [Candidatus Dojkabacteria bacterium]|nr:hypothetical protein [Candidatus Dojkabacteria bacterium]
MLTHRGNVYTLDKGLGFQLMIANEEGAPRPAGGDEVDGLLTLADYQTNRPEPGEVVLVGLWDDGTNSHVLVPFVFLGQRGSIPSEHRGDPALRNLANWTGSQNLTGAVTCILPHQIRDNTEAFQRTREMAGIHKYLGFIKWASQIDGSTVTWPLFRVTGDCTIKFG